MTAPVAFDTTLSSFGTNTGIVVPDDVIAALGGGHRPPVVVTVNGHEFRSTVAVMKGQHLISFSAALRKQTGLSGGDPIRVTLAVADAPREVVVPDDLASALAAEPGCAEFFAALSNSLQRYHVDQVTGTSNPDTRARRVEKALALFREGKKR
jgi:hypothetical protein